MTARTSSYTPTRRQRRPLDDETVRSVRGAVLRMGKPAVERALRCSRDTLLDVIEPGGVFLPETAAKLEAAAKELGS